MSATVRDLPATGTEGPLRRPSSPDAVEDDAAERGVLATAVTPLSRPNEEGGVVRSCMIGAALGFTIITIVITVVGSTAGMATGSALGLGAFVGMWGGAGFGFMMGGTLAIMRVLDADDLARATDHTRRPT